LCATQASSGTYHRSPAAALLEEDDLLGSGTGEGGGTGDDAACRCVGVGVLTTNPAALLRPCRSVSLSLSLPVLAVLRSHAQGTNHACV